MDGPVLESPLQDLPVLEKGKRPVGAEQEPDTCRAAPCTPVQAILTLRQDYNNSNSSPTPLISCPLLLLITKATTAPPFPFFYRRSSFITIALRELRQWPRLRWRLTSSATETRIWSLSYCDASCCRKHVSCLMCLSSHDQQGSSSRQSWHTGTIPDAKLPQQKERKNVASRHLNVIVSSMSNLTLDSSIFPSRPVTYGFGAKWKNAFPNFCFPSKWQVEGLHPAACVQQVCIPSASK